MANPNISQALQALMQSGAIPKPTPQRPVPTEDPNEMRRILELLRRDTPGEFRGPTPSPAPLEGVLPSPAAAVPAGQPQRELLQTPQPAPQPQSPENILEAAGEAQIEAESAGDAAIELESQAAGEAAQQQTQQLLQNATQVTQELGGQEAVQQQVSQGVSQAIGEETAPEEINEAVPLMKRILGDLSEERAELKSELSRKLEAPGPKQLSKQEKIAVGLLMILPAIAGAMLGGKRGAGQGLQASGQALLGLNKQLAQQQRAEQQRFERQQERRPKLRERLAQVNKESLEISKQLDEASVDEAGDIPVHPNYETTNPKLLKSVKEKEFTKFREAAAAEETALALYKDVESRLESWDSADKVRAILGDPNMAAAMQRDISELILIEKDIFGLGALQEGEFKLMQRFIGDIMRKLIISALLVLGSLGIADYQMDSYKISGVATTGRLNRNNSELAPEGLNPKGHQIPMLLEHSAAIKDIIGHVTKYTGTIGGVYFEAVLNPQDHQQYVIDRIIQNDLAYVSIGYITLTGEGRFSETADWLELSLVTIPADPDAKILSIERMGVWFHITKALRWLTQSPQELIRN